MRTTSLRPHASRVSIASRVVPGTSETIARSSPRSAFSRLDFPTFGRPTKAIAAGSPSRFGCHRRVPACGLGLDRIVAVEVGPFDAVGIGSVARLGIADDERLELARRDLVGPRLGFGLARLARKLGLALGRQRPHDRIEQVAGTATVARRDRIRLVPAERMELGAFELALLVVGLVDGDDDRAPSPAEGSWPPRGRPASSRSRHRRRTRSRLPGRSRDEPAPGPASRSGRRGPARGRPYRRR